MPLDGYVAKANHGKRQHIKSDDIQVSEVLLNVIERKAFILKRSIKTLVFIREIIETVRILLREWWNKPCTISKLRFQSFVMSI